MFYIDLYRENMKKCSCLRALIFGMYDHLVDLYQVCSNYTAHWSYLPWMNLKGKPCSLHNFYTLSDILIIFDRHIYWAKSVCHVQEWLLSCASCLSYFP